MILVSAMILDALFGEPKLIWDRIPHPAVVMGRLIAALEARLNRGEGRRLKGAAMTAGLAFGAMLAGWLIHLIPDHGILEALLVAILLAQRSLVDHVRAVATGLRRSLAEGRSTVAMIVGRDTAAMREPDVARAAIESAAENLSDGVVAPVFWYLLLGLPGILMYKLANTADSIIGHMSPATANSAGLRPGLTTF